MRSNSEPLNNEDIRADLQQILAKLIGKQRVFPETKLFHDLHLAGDDAWELLEDINGRYDTSFEEMPFSQYFPNETESMGVFWTRWLGSGRNYRPLTVGHLTQVIGRGAWFDP